jgi:arsenate reductase-like glutaredoxin family protein
MSQPAISNNTNCVPQHVQTIPSTSYQQKTHQHYHQRPYTYRTSSTSEDDPDTGTVNVNEWQQVTNNKRRKINTRQIYTTNTDITTNNRFNSLPIEESDSQENPANKIPKPPPIFIYGVVNYNEMENKLAEIIEQEQYSTKSMADNTIKVNCTTAETYRKLVAFLKGNNIVHHTYQLKQERAYRVVIKYLHHSVSTKEIENQLTQMGHNVRNVINGRHRITKQPLNIFFVDLEPARNNKDIYNIHMIHNKIITIEPPRKNTGLTQCFRCQQYGHTKTYCNRPYICVKCGGSHSTASCKKTHSTPAKCALCDGPHPANYKGCEFYHSLIKTKNTNNRKNAQPNHPVNSQNTNPLARSETPKPTTNNAYRKASYAEVTRGTPYNSQQEEDTTPIALNRFLEEFKNMFTQLIQQNTMILNMLSTILTNSHNG